MSADHIIQFGHSDTERLVLSNFDVDPDTYSLDAEVCAGSFRGMARVYGRLLELEDLHKSLQQLSVSLSGETTFQNQEQQLTLHCYIGTLGGVHMKVLLTDYRNQVECSFETDPISLDSTIASLGLLVASAQGRR